MKIFPAIDIIGDNIYMNGKTKIFQAEQFPENASKLLKIFNDNEDLVIDIGGNKSTEIYLDLLSQSGMIRLIDLFLIPTLDGLQDANNALDTADLIRKMAPTAKIMLVLNQVYEFAAEQFEDLLEMLRGKHQYLANGITRLYASSVIKKCRKNGLTVADAAALNLADAEAELGELVKKMKKGEKIKTDEYSRLLNKISNIKAAKNYMEKCLKPACADITYTITNTGTELDAERDAAYLESVAAAKPGFFR